MHSSRKKVLEKDAPALVEQWRMSGLPMPLWCSQRGIDARSLRGWARRLEHLPDVRLVEMLPPPSQAAAHSTGISLHLLDLTIHLPDSFSEDTLARVLRVVRAC